MDSKYKNKKIITKEKLYQKPDLSDIILDPKNEQNPSPSLSGAFKVDWTRNNFERAGDTAIESTFKRKSLNNKPGQSILKDLMKPSFSSKAQRMMQKMGWEGGALGKKGEGIIEPIIPDMSMIKRKAGFGNRTKNLKTKKQLRQIKNHQTITSLVEKIELSNKENFSTNTLLAILDFVQDDTESELVFDCKLSRTERRNIHRVVNELLEAEELVSYDSNAVLELCEYIQSCNKLNLNTESQGTPPKRYLYVYKTAPRHVYLVTPEDFLDEDVQFDVIEKQKLKKLNKRKDLNTEKELELVKDISDDINNINFMDNTNTDNKVEIKTSVSLTTGGHESKKSNLLSQDECANEIEIETSQEIWLKKFANKLTDFVTEFSNGKKYTEMRFLGKFKSEEMDFIEDFTSKLNYIDREEVTIGRKEEITTVLSKLGKRLSTENDYNESIVITKTIA